MNKHGIAAMVGLALLLAPISFADSFVVAKTKKPSAAALKERCTESVADVLRSSPMTLVGIARMQEAAIDMMTEIVDGEFFSCATKDDLQADVIFFEQFVSRQEQIDQLIAQQVNFLHSQKKKYTIKRT